MTTIIELNTALALRRALRHAKEVIQRPHVRAETAVDRVGIFLTSLRRETKGSDTYNLCRRHLWSDIGVLSSWRGSYNMHEQVLVNFALNEQPEESERIVQENRALLQYLAENTKHLDLHHEELKRNNASIEGIGSRVASIIERSLNCDSPENLGPDRPAPVAGGNRPTAWPGPNEEVDLAERLR